MPYQFFTIPAMHGEEAQRQLNAFLAALQTFSVGHELGLDPSRENGGFGMC